MKTSKFFVSCPPQFETLLVDDLRRNWAFLLDESARPHTEPFPELKFLRGGVEFESSQLAALQLNHFLRGAHRVLLRWGSFHADRFDILKLEAKKLAHAGPPWEGSLPIEFRVETESSRLNHKRNIEECLSEALSKISRFSPPENSPSKERNPASQASLVETSTQKIFVRISRDKVTLSLDSSGEHLHKRGYLRNRSSGALRETFAHALLQETFQGCSANELEKAIIFDPFMGSGTLLWEAFLLRGPLFFRKFSYQNWARIPKLLKSPTYAQNFNKIDFAKINFLCGQDQSEKALQAAQNNLAYLKEHGSSRPLETHLLQADSFKNDMVSSLSLSASQRANLFLVANLPYGEQVEISQDFDQKLKRLIEKIQPRRFGLLGKNLKKFQPKGYKALSLREFSNQGILVDLVVYQFD